MSKYEAPAVFEIASIHELTLGLIDKDYNPKSDGYTFRGDPIGDLS